MRWGDVSSLAVVETNMVTARIVIGMFVVSSLLGLRWGFGHNAGAASS